MMDAEQWRLAKSIFQAALELPADERTACIEERCESPEMRQALLKMIQDHNEDTNFLQSPLQEPNPQLNKENGSSASPEFDSLIGTKFSDFEIVKRIGSGGMGTVFEARQNHPLRFVAIKIINPTTGPTEKNVLRFEHEAEILARLQHPGICRVYAAGWHDFVNGRQPWFAMELIAGEPLKPSAGFIKNASIRQKLGLLLMICDAVQHAHGRGVIHRDLKPGNILIVQSEDSTEFPLGQPKIVDFGVARVLDSDRRESLRTATGDIMGTLNYMCPEQITADPAAIDERCDVYGLGVIGYEILAGVLPHDRRGSSIAASLRMVEQDAPLRLGEANSSLGGDLQIVFEKALEKDPERRYRSVSELAEDLRRYLNNEPILARPATSWYRCRKFVSRHRTLVGGVTATIFALAIGMVLYANEAKQARLAAAESRYEADKANAVNNFMTNDFMMKLLAAGNEHRDGEPPAAFELVSRAAKNVDAMFDEQPTIEAAIRNEIGTIFYNLNAFEEAKRQFQTSLELWRSSLGAEHSDTLKAVNNLGLTHRCLGEKEIAEKFYRQALTGRQKTLGDSHPLTLVTMNNLANLLQSDDRNEEAEMLLRGTLEMQRTTLGMEHKETLTTMTNLGNLLRGAGELEAALQMHRQAWKTSTKIIGADHVMPLKIGNSYASTLYSAEKYEEAREILKSNLVEFLKISTPENYDVIMTRRLLARTYRKMDQPLKAKEHLQAALDAVRATKNPDRLMVRRIERDLNRLND